MLLLQKYDSCELLQKTLRTYQEEPHTQELWSSKEIRHSSCATNIGKISNLLNYQFLKKHNKNPSTCLSSFNNYIGQEPIMFVCSIIGDHLASLEIKKKIKNDTWLAQQLKRNLEKVRGQNWRNRIPTRTKCSRYKPQIKKIQSVVIQDLHNSEHVYHDVFQKLTITSCKACHDASMLILKINQAMSMRI